MYRCHGVYVCRSEDKLLGHLFFHYVGLRDKTVIISLKESYSIPGLDKMSIVSAPEGLTFLDNDHIILPGLL